MAEGNLKILLGKDTYISYKDCKNVILIVKYALKNNFTAFYTLFATT